jgi:catechol 2,3-dioxygenase-like lactoylglutathione lyase family enzyme
MFRVERLDHIALTVSDVARSVEWYRSVPGLERRHEEAWGDYPAVVCASDTCIALFPAASADPIPSTDRRNTITVRHFAFRVDRRNFDSARAELHAQGIEFSFEDHEICDSIYLHDPDGHEIELTTYEV